jgi:hypothetical protein
VGARGYQDSGPDPLPGRLPMVVVPEKPPLRSHTEAGKFVLTAWKCKPPHSWVTPGGVGITT